MKTLPYDRTVWLRAWVRTLLAGAGLSLLAHAQAQTGPTATQPTVSNFVSPLVQGLNLITTFGFISGCVMVIGGFLNARRDENWKMTVIYGIGVAGAVALMKALFFLFTGTNNSSNWISEF